MTNKQTVLLVLVLSLEVVLLGVGWKLVELYLQ